MPDPEILIDVTDAWVNGNTEVTSVVIAEFRGAPRFALVPSDERDREAIASRIGVCKKCGGRGYEPVSWGKQMRGVECPRCKGKTKSPDDVDVRLAILKHVCQGWEGWLTKDGGDVPFTDAMIEKVAAHGGAYVAIVAASQKLNTEYRDAEAKN